MKKILTVLGARPQFIKASVVLNAMAQTRTCLIVRGGARSTLTGASRIRRLPRQLHNRKRIETIAPIHQTYCRLCKAAIRAKKINRKSIDICKICRDASNAEN